ncbi:MAG: accessory factor UbiK family protein [Proteobacteria bacterium]|nr:accessory factor UbiK family protein [Pseudomonadota bacterium]MCH8176080.1 accessory factor UbiK family protein [Pseudomonadota bacterium]
MRDKNFLDELASRLSSMLPVVRELSSELRTKIEQQLAKALTEMDLLTRSEFDAQSKVLRRAERRIDELAATILELEKRLQQFEKDSSQQ